MHRSRLGTFVIDCRGSDVAKAAEFWSKALGRAVKKVEGEEAYRELESAPAEPQILVQSVDHESRIHLDIESDDQEAEAARLEKLGCKRVGWVKNWWVMEAPTGQRFCVVRPQRGPLNERANQW